MYSRALLGGKQVADRDPGAFALDLGLTALLVGGGILAAQGRQPLPSLGQHHGRLVALRIGQPQHGGQLLQALFGHDGVDGGGGARGSGLVVVRRTKPERGVRHLERVGTLVDDDLDVRGHAGQQAQVLVLQPRLRRCRSRRSCTTRGCLRIWTTSP